MKKLILIFAMFLSLNVSAQGKKYYVAVSGNDQNNGLSPHTAWRSIQKINGTNFKPGDTVLFAGGEAFDGTIKLSSDDSGSLARPVVLTSFGRAKAIVNGGDSDGLLAVNTSFIKIKDLVFTGSGVNKNKGGGIHFFSNDTLKAPSYIDIEACDAKGFLTYGIVFGAEGKLSCKGYRHVRITGCNASENGQGGIGSYGDQRGFQHKDFIIKRCKAFNNRGVLGQTNGHSGNGIVMSMIDGLLIDHCEAFENGADNRCDAGGPVGIWVWMCKNAIIQNCVSHNNHAGGTKDGGGFDIDGGASNCIMQYNYSYDNEGAGYLLAEFGALFPFTNNIVRFNVSVNDGRKNNYGGIAIWGASSEYSVTNSAVYNNTVCVDDSHLINGMPAALTFMGVNFKNVLIANNIFVTKGSAHLINADTIIAKPAAYLLHNNYYSFDNQYAFDYGHQKFQSIQKWIEGNPEQEISNGKASMINIDPLFVNNPFDKQRKANFSLQKTSKLRSKLFVVPVYSKKKAFPGVAQ